MAQMKWGMICSVGDQNFLPFFKDFGEWLVKSLEAYGSELYLKHKFEPKAKFQLHCEPSDKEMVEAAYASIMQNYSDVLYVIHILPDRDSVEYNLMRDLTVQYALVGQGVLAMTALTRFKGSGEIIEIMDNMNQWIGRRLSQILNRHRTENNFHLTVHGPNPVPLKFNFDFDSSVEAILHSTIQMDDQNVLEKMVIVGGFPPSFNKFQVASIFTTFRPVNVLPATCSQAIVEFANKFHAAQIVSTYNLKRFEDECFTLNVKTAVGCDYEARMEAIRQKLLKTSSNPENSATAEKSDTLAVSPSNFFAGQASVPIEKLSICP